MVAYVQTVKTRSGATAVQIVWSSRRGSRRIKHVGSAHDASELEALKAAACQRLAEGQIAFDLGLNFQEFPGTYVSLRNGIRTGPIDRLTRG